MIVGYVLQQLTQACRGWLSDASSGKGKSSFGLLVLLFARSSHAFQESSSASIGVDTITA